MRAADRLRTGDLHHGEVVLLPAELQPHGALPRCRPGRNAHTRGERTPIRRASFRELDSNQRAPASRTGWDAVNRPGTNWSPRQVPPLASRPYKGRPLAGAGASTLGGTRTRNHMALDHARLPVCGTSAREPPPGADPGHPPYEGGAAAVRGGKATLPGFEPGTSWFRAKRCCRLS